MNALPRRFSVAMLLLAGLFLGGCASMGDYGYPGSGYPGSSGYPSQGARQQLQGTVSNVDHRNRRFLLDDRSGRRTDVSYDGRTRLTYRGQTHAVSGLEPGDQVRVLASSLRGYGSGWLAEDIEVISDVRSGGYGSGYGSGYGDLVQRRGAIDYVDTRSGVIGYTEGGFTGSRQQVRFDNRTLVEYRGQRYPVSALERGDMVRFELRRSGSTWFAERVLVEVSSRDR